MTKQQPDWIQELFWTLDKGEIGTIPKFLYTALTLEPEYFTKAVNRTNQRLETEKLNEFGELATVIRQFFITANPSEESWTIAWNELIRTLAHFIDEVEAQQLFKEHVDLIDWWSSESLLSLQSWLTIFDYAERVDSLEQFSSYLPDIFESYAIETAKDKAFARLAWYAMASGQQDLLSPYLERIDQTEDASIRSIRDPKLLDQIETTRVFMLESKRNQPIELMFDRKWTL
ncbi:hypothetical protein [Exiguobacterium flavidum]|uniref:hypothetical protein n=1 Tax=Exiguobacterium flavidum TaxID=2184695 RepID=UPI000DF769A4|nr:hypothetical protein [Exiguobacterium flavidum]